MVKTEEFLIGNEKQVFEQSIKPAFIKIKEYGFDYHIQVWLVHFEDTGKVNPEIPHGVFRVSSPVTNTYTEFTEIGDLSVYFAEQLRQIETRTLENGFIRGSDL